MLQTMYARECFDALNLIATFSLSIAFYSLLVPGGLKRLNLHHSSTFVQLTSFFLLSWLACISQKNFMEIKLISQNLLNPNTSFQKLQQILS